MLGLTFFGIKFVQQISEADLWMWYPLVNIDYRPWRIDYLCEKVQVRTILQDDINVPVPNLPQSVQAFNEPWKLLRTEIQFVAVYLYNLIGLSVRLNLDHL